MSLRIICDCDNTMPLPGMPIDDRFDALIFAATAFYLMTSL